MNITLILIRIRMGLFQVSIALEYLHESVRILNIFIYYCNHFNIVMHYINTLEYAIEHC